MLFFAPFIEIIFSVDEKAIEILTSSKILAQEIVEKQNEARQTEVEIDETRDLYKRVATNACTLFFTISELSSIDPMYIYSLNWFIDLFEIVWIKKILILRI